VSKNNEAPYGYRYEESKLVPNAGEQAVIVQIKALKKAGLTKEQIAAELDRAGLKSRPTVRRCRPKKPKPSAADNMVSNILFSFQKFALETAAEKAMEAWDKTRQMGKSEEEADKLLSEAGFDPVKMKQIARRNGPE
jgi:hypothetical protein